ncbi:amino acid ABC transporter permease [Saccharothrix violaceirubra]|uniref:Polar amino acid transport system permease protein n=1 Tax=Saccharothrix violaceirubra TaxID=413306 RepID=A0A7W7WUQ8_9PSEU|nr:amino acid ABC transporter permease [Saccharothrix violaceirubra]MBB4964519.1 polar amino acid transport system permease protein [Saccharothrix violaceirubra]
MSVSAQPRLRAPDDEPGDETGTDLSRLKVVPSRHPWRWVGVVVVLVLVAMFVNGLVTNPGWDWPTFFKFFTAESILRAVVITLELTLYGTVIGFALGVVLAIMRLSRSTFLIGVSWTYIWAFRSIPLIVQLLFWFNISYLYQELHFGIPFGPTFFGVDTKDLISPMGAAVLGLALHQAAYAAEIVRSGIIAVDHGQLEAASALGIPKVHQFRRIILPQAMRSILPNAANEVISLFKGTSVVSVVAIGELFYQVQVIYGRNARVVALLMVATVWYIALTTVLSVIQHYVEKRYAKGATRDKAGWKWER